MGLRHRRLVSWVDVGAIAFVVAMLVLGSTLATAREGLTLSGASHSLFLSTYKPFVGRWTIVSVIGLGLCVVAAHRMVRGSRGIVAGSFVIALAARIVVNISRRGPSELAYPFTGPERHNEYIAVVPFYIGHPLRFLRDFAGFGRVLPEHVAGHPAGATMLVGALAQVGLAGPWPEVVLILLLGAATAPLVWFLGCELVDQASARRAVAIWIFAPSVLIESATSLDAVFTFAGVVAALLLVRLRTGLAAVAVTVCTFLSYSLVAIPLWGVFMIAHKRGVGRAARVAIAVSLVMVGFYVLLWIATGYDPIAAYQATAHRYFLGAGGRRSYWFWLVGDTAAFGLALGLPTWIGLVRAVWCRTAPALALAVVIVAASISGYTRGEVERVWLFMTPMAVIAAAPMMARWRSGLVLAVIAAQAMAVELLYRTPW